MSTPHKHADLIIAWANGAEIQWLAHNGQWIYLVTPNWNAEYQYRIKPEKKWVRNYEYYLSDDKVSFVVGCCVNEKYEAMLNIMPHFKRWITDRIYYE